MKSVPTKTLLLSVFIALAGCGSVSSGNDAGKSSGAVIDMISAPAGAKIVNDQSLMMGSGENWVGRVVLELSQSSSAAYNFFLDQYPQQGWTLVSAVRGKTSLLVFTKADRSATVELAEGGMLGGSTATLTVSPKNTLPAAPPPAKRQ